MLRQDAVRLHQPVSFEAGKLWQLLSYRLQHHSLARTNSSRQRCVILVHYQRGQVWLWHEPECRGGKEGWFISGTDKLKKRMSAFVGILIVLLTPDLSHFTYSVNHRTPSALKPVHLTVPPPYTRLRSTTGVMSIYFSPCSCQSSSFGPHWGEDGPLISITACH